MDKERSPNVRINRGTEIELLDMIDACSSKIVEMPL